MGRILILVVLTAVLCGVAVAADVPSQEGLPPELTIAPTPPLTEQLQTLQGLRAWTEANRPRGGGFLGGISKLFSGGSDQAQPVQAGWLVQTPDMFRGKKVEVCGIYKTVSADVATLDTEAGPIRISRPQGVEVLGITAKTPDGLPIAVQGLVETTGAIPQIRAAVIKPSDWLVLLRMGRIEELLGQLDTATKTYQQAAGGAATTAFNGFARTRPGLIAYERRQHKTARGQLSASWNALAGTDRTGRPKAYTWVKGREGEGWEKIAVTKAIAEPLDSINRNDFWYKFMEFFVTLAGNMPWLGIVLLAIVSRVVIWPLTKKQLASGAAMQRLQPQIKALQDKYVDDKQQFQQEFWKLCQANGVNPLGGCLPMLIQMPVLIFLYKGIQQYIVKFDGHGFLWVKNLAAPDLPLLVIYALSMVAFQKMTQKLQPTTAMNPQQAQQQQMMTYMMPVMFFFFFQSFPAAFLLYWVATNVVYFAQQYAYQAGEARKHPPDGGTESLVSGEKKSGGLVGAMTRMLSMKAEPEETKPTGDQKSFHEKQAQAKGKKTARPDEKPGGAKRPRK